jgi:hypothetical protein
MILATPEWIEQLLAKQFISSKIFLPILSVCKREKRESNFFNERKRNKESEAKRNVTGEARRD